MSSDNEWPVTNHTDHHDRHIIVHGWNDIDSAPDVSGRDKHRVATILSEQSWDVVAWVPKWLLEDDKSLETVDGSDQLVVGNIRVYSEDSWAVEQIGDDNGMPEFLPKSQTVVFERAKGTETIETPQAGLDSFGVEQ